MRLCFRSAVTTATLLAATMWPVSAQQLSIESVVAETLQHADEIRLSEAVARIAYERSLAGAAASGSRLQSMQGKVAWAEAGASFSRSRETLALRAVSAYAQLRDLLVRVPLLAEQVVLQREELTRVRTRLELWVTNQLQVLQARVTVATAEQALARSQDDLTAAVRELAVLTHRDERRLAGSSLEILTTTTPVPSLPQLQSAATARVAVVNLDRRIAIAQLELETAVVEQRSAVDIRERRLTLERAQVNRRQAVADIESDLASAFSAHESAQTALLIAELQQERAVQDHRNVLAQFESGIAGESTLQGKRVDSELAELSVHSAKDSLYQSYLRLRIAAGLDLAILPVVE